jgi:hypothetical protein
MISRVIRSKNRKIKPTKPANRKWDKLQVVLTLVMGAHGQTWKQCLRMHRVFKLWICFLEALNISMQQSVQESTLIYWPGALQNDGVSTTHGPVRMLL